LDNLNDSQKKVSELVQFLCARPPTEEELIAAARPQFNFQQFRFQLLVGDECAGRWPNVIKTFSRYAQAKKESAGTTHKIAHDLAVVRRDLDRAQVGIDAAQEQMLALLRQVDSIASVSATIQDIQLKILEIGKVASGLQDKLQTYLAQEQE
jgi:hypothetical protein